MSSRPEIIKARQDKNARISYLSFPAKPMPHGLLLQFQEYNYNKYISTLTQDAETEKFVMRTNGGLLKAKSVAEISQNSAIELPFPRSLQDSQGIRIQGFERDFMMERAASALAGMGDGSGASFAGKIADTTKNALASIKEGSKSFFSDPVGAIQTMMNAAGDMDTKQGTAIAAYLARNIVGGDLTKTLSAVSGRTINPQETLSFSGVDLKSFTFSWDLFPSNSKDTEQLRTIVQFLKNRSLPETEGVEGIEGTQRAFLKYPDIVELNLLGVNEAHFQQFKRCMISNVTVDYGGGGGMPQIIKGGVPAAVTLSITFNEVEIHTRSDYPVTEQPKPDQEQPEQISGSGAAAGNT